MKFAPFVLAGLLSSCGGPRTRHVGGAGEAPLAADYSATRFIPAKPTYAVAAKKVRDAQRALADAVDTAGMFARVDARMVSAGLVFMLGFDPLSPDGLAQLGVDLDGGIAIFSESIDPTLVVHLADPAKTRAFFEQLPPHDRIRWTIDKDWLRVDVFTDLADRNAPHADGPPTWTADWAWAEKSAGTSGTPPVVGFVDLRALLAALSVKLPDAVACAKLVAPVEHAGIAFDGDGKRLGVRVAIDIGAASAGVAGAVLPAPENWDAVASRAPLAAQWNLDLEVARSWIAPCVRTFGVDLARFDGFGVRAGRVILQTLDPEDKTGTGAIALDITNRQTFEGLLDEIPLRSTMESSRTYGPYTGKRLSIPFGPKVDYVLTDKLLLAGVGDGLLARVVAPGSSASRPGALLAVDVSPQGLTIDAWRFLLRTAQVPAADQIAERMQAFRDARLAIRLDGTRLVFEAMGNRR